LNNIYTNTVLDPSDPTTKGFKSFNLNEERNLDITGWDAQIGILAKLNMYFTIGATVKFPRTYTITDVYTVNGLSNFTNTGFIYGPYSDRLEYDVVTPYEFTLGGAFTGNHITISADVKLIDYTQMEFTNTPSYENSGIDWAQKNQEIKDSMSTVININVGAEYSIPNSNVNIRAGFMYAPSAYRSDPSSFNKKYFTLGLGYDATKYISLNVAYAYGWWKDYGDNYGVGLSRTFQDITMNNAVFTLKYNF
jgi:long-subunit fatty acid transport protein